VKSWHASLKHEVKADMVKWSLCDIVQHLANVAVQWNRKAAKKEAEFCTQHLSDTVFWSGMRKLSYPVQLLVFHKKKRASQLLNDEVNPQPLKDDFSCNCLFFQQYTLSCQHVWQQKLLVEEVLTEDVWDCYTFMFEDCNFKIYKEITTTYSTKKIYEKIDASSKQWLEVSSSSSVDNLLTLLSMRNPEQSSYTILQTWRGCSEPHRQSESCSVFRVNRNAWKDNRASSKTRGEWVTRGYSRGPMIMDTRDGFTIEGSGSLKGHTWGAEDWSQDRDGAEDLMSWWLREVRGVVGEEWWQQG